MMAKNNGKKITGCSNCSFYNSCGYSIAIGIHRLCPLPDWTEPAAEVKADPSREDSVTAVAWAIFNAPRWGKTAFEDAYMRASKSEPAAEVYVRVKPEVWERIQKLEAENAKLKAEAARIEASLLEQQDASSADKMERIERLEAENERLTTALVEVLDDSLRACLLTLEHVLEE